MSGNVNLRHIFEAPPINTNIYFPRDHLFLPVIVVYLSCFAVDDGDILRVSEEALHVQTEISYRLELRRLVVRKAVVLYHYTQTYISNGLVSPGH